MKRRDFTTLLLNSIMGTGTFSSLIYSSASNNKNLNDDHIKDYIYKMRHFDDHHKNDFFLKGDDLKLLNSTFNRFRRVQRVVGHGNFSLLDFDEALIIARNYRKVGKFTKAEKDFLEKLKYARVWGKNVYDGQMVQRDHILKDGDIVEIHL